MSRHNIEDFTGLRRQGDEQRPKNVMRLFYHKIFSNLIVLPSNH